MFGGNTSLDVTAMKMIAFNIYLPILSLHFQKKNKSEQIYFPNGKSIDIQSYTTLIKNIPTSKILFNISQDEPYLNRLHGAQVDLESLNKLNLTINNVSFFGENTKDSIKYIDYYCSIGWSTTKQNIPSIPEHIQFRNDQFVIGNSGCIHFFDSTGNLLNTLELTDTGFFDYLLTEDQDYLLVYSGYYHEFVEVQSERIKIYHFPELSLKWETTNLPPEFGPLYAFHNYFQNGSYVFHPERSKVYYLPNNDMSQINNWEPNGVLLQNGTFLDFDKDWDSITFKDFQSRNNK